MRGDKERWLAPSATPWDDADEGSLGPAETLVMACHRDIYRYRHAGASLGGEADFFNAYVRESCPRCKSSEIEGDGKDPNGIRRWLCKSCNRSFNVTTGTIFESHRVLVVELSLTDEAHNSKLIKALPDKENPLADVNELCFLLELFLNSHSGFDRSRLEGYLDLFYVMMNDPEEKMEKAALVLDRAMRFPYTLRYREYYRKKTSSARGQGS